MLRAAGADIDVTAASVVLRPGGALEARRWEVPGDISSGLFLLAAAVIIEGSHLTLTNLGLNPRRARALSVMERMGADLVIERTGERCGEPVGTVTVSASPLTATDIEGDEIPALIDELPILAVLAACAEGETVIRDASELRLKESDRIEAMVAGLQSLGVDCEARPDGMAIRGPARLTGGEVDSRGDHRVAMSLAVAGLRTLDPVRVRGWSCVNTSFPEFLDLLGRAQGRHA
jgi:3-phosphoshikimate 1-carboxyvinyltransferase